MSEMEQVPFIRMLYEYKGMRKTFDCDFPIQFLKKFEGENADDYNIGFFFVMGKRFSCVKTLQDAIQICKD